MRLSRSLAAGLAACALAPALAGAQPESGPAVSFGVRAGGAMPVGKWSRLAYDTDVQAAALAEVRLPVSWLRVRVDAGYQRLDGGRTAFTDTVGIVLATARQHTRILSGTASVVVRAPGLRSAVRPYAVAGVGLFRLQSHLKPDGRGVIQSGYGPRLNYRGASVGLGAEAGVGRATVFAEAQYQRIGGGSLRVMPLSLGVRMR